MNLYCVQCYALHWTDKIVHRGFSTLEVFFVRMCYINSLLTFDIWHISGLLILNPVSVMINRDRLIWFGRLKRRFLKDSTRSVDNYGRLRFYAKMNIRNS